MAQFNKGDTICDIDGNVSKIVDVTSIYKLENGKTWNEDGISRVVSPYDDKRHVLNLCEKLGTTLEQMQASSRKRELVTLRHGLMYYLKVKSGWSQQRIGNMLNRNHSTIHFGAIHFKDMLDQRISEFVETWDKLNDQYIKELFND